MQIPKPIMVVGAGVSGLTTAICLAEAGLPIRIRADRPPRDTASSAAGALWEPYLVHDLRVQAWSDVTHAVLAGLAAEIDTGVRMGHGMEAGRSPVRPSTRVAGLAGFRRCRPDELPLGFHSGWWFTAPLLDMPTYLDYLVRRLGAAGVKIESSRVPSIDAALALAPVIINCSGAGARDLVPDPAVMPVRGQLVVVENPGVDGFFVECETGSEQPTYFIPHGTRLLLGGSVERGRRDLDPDPGVARDIIDRCQAVEPRIAGSRVLGHRVGLRPTRPAVRLERVDVGRGHVIHNYGHGGAGVTLSWGCARDVLTLVRDL